MLAYIFWHWPYPQLDRESYRDDLLRFHRALAAAKPEGFQYSTVFQIKSAPWLQTDFEAYEDWYLVDGSCALDSLNEAAISHSREEPHDRVAQKAAGGAGGLYRFRGGQVNVAESRFAVWLSKPHGTSYEAFYDLLSRWTRQPEVGLWGRQMVLGPTPEFCLLSAHVIDLPETYMGLKLSLDQIWPAS